METINSYRLTSLEEPTDDMLHQIMSEAAEDARRKGDAAHKRYFDLIRKDIIAQSQFGQKNNL
ncbi:MAG TPA: hypothetical protein DHV83_06805 [Prevotella sp.]|jgi:hypothetical protein|uniref:Uncharacterized protein n=1 Tax=Hallella mizrahii TaxID=2606637 RepID=A0A7K0KC95_9BACT|nr:hypothetical protein [Hallella mizrahii]MDD5821967.1 hypothetical protein [Prevotella sp.]MST83553.1 hypothetical protein [Hallella mizrahii]HCJ47247.1 hypothetical protein [Prevotella sp.]